MTLLIWTLFYGPDGAPPLFALGADHASAARRRGSHSAWRSSSTSSSASGILFLSVTRIEEFAYALTRLGMPYKVGFTMTLAFRLVPVFVDAAATVVQAQRCRGLDFERGGALAADAALRAGDRAGLHGRAAARRSDGDGARRARLPARRAAHRAATRIRCAARCGRRRGCLIGAVAAICVASGTLRLR